MAKKNITFRIDEDLIDKLNELRGNKSQNAILEALLTEWEGTSTSTSTSTSNESQVQVQLLAQTKAIEALQVQVQLLVNQQVQEKSKPKSKVKPKPPVSLMDEEEDDAPAFSSSSVDIPEWQKKELTPQDFYGKIPEPIKNEIDPNDPIEIMLREAGMR